MARRLLSLTLTGNSMQQLDDDEEERGNQGCQMAKFDPFLSLDCHREEGMGAQLQERKGSNFAAQRSGAIVLQARRAKHIRSRNLV